MSLSKKLLIIGDGEFAEIAYEYFSRDSDYEVIGFAVEREFLTKKELFGLPVIAFENSEDVFLPEAHYAFVAITYTKLNRVRTRLYLAAKEKGYKIASYVSSKAFVWHNVKIGENCFIFENNVLQYCVEIGDNVILWSGNHVGHQTKIQNNCFVSSHVVISGYCNIGENCFIGVNSTFADHLVLGEDCFVSMATGFTKSMPGGCIYKGVPAQPSKLSSYQYFKLDKPVLAED